MIDVIIGIISVSFLFFMVRIFMKFNSATYKNNFTKNDNFIVENVKVIKIVIAVCTCIIGAIWLLFVLICSKKGAETGNLIPTLIFTLVFIIAIYISMNMANWRLIIEGKNITHINWRGKATHYNFENIKIKVCSNLTIKVYEGNRKVIVIDSNMKNLSSFMSWADAYKIPRI